MSSLERILFSFVFRLSNFSGIVEGKVALDNKLFNYHYTRLFLDVGL